MVTAAAIAVVTAVAIGAVTARAATGASRRGFAPPLAAVALKFGDPEIFALMLLAFATFIGLGGDDIPKTIFSICFGLVLAAVGFDIVSGEPRLIFFDITEFAQGQLTDLSIRAFLLWIVYICLIILSVCSAGGAGVLRSGFIA